MVKKKKLLIIFVLAGLVTGLSWLWQASAGNCKFWGFPRPYYSECFYGGLFPAPSWSKTRIIWQGLFIDLLFWFLVLAAGWWVVKKLKIGLVSLLAVGAVLVAGWLVWSNRSLPKVDQPAEIAITTDKTEYEQGETVKITIRNGLDKSIFGGFGHCGGLPFWDLQKFDNGDWRDLDFSLPYSEKGKEVCDLILCEREKPAELKSGLTIEDRWHLTSICEWPEKPIGVPKTEPKPIEEGAYRVRLIYGLNRREFDLLETNAIYSNEFIIKEKKR